MNVQCHRELCEFTRNYLVKLIFGKYFYYFNSNCVAASLQLQLYFDANPVPVRERVNVLELKLYSMYVKLQVLAGCDITSATR